MILGPMQNLEIFDTATGRDGVWFSLRFDGVTIYGLFLPKIIKLFSGTWTVGAFENADKHSLVAWIDPVSGKFISLKSNWLYSVYGVMILIGYFGMAFMAWGGLWLRHMETAFNKHFANFSLTALAVMCFTSVVFCALKATRKSPLEIELREELAKNMYSEHVSVKAPTYSDSL